MKRPSKQKDIRNGEVYLWNLFNIKAVIYAHRFKDYKWELNEYDVTLSDKNSTQDLNSGIVYSYGLDSLSKKSTFTFISTKQIDINAKDTFKFNYNDKEEHYLIETVQERVYNPAEMHFEYTITAVDYTYYLIDFRVNLSFPRSNEYNHFQIRDYRSSYDIANRIRTQLYMQSSNIDEKYRFVLFDIFEGETEEDADGITILSKKGYPNYYKGSLADKLHRDTDVDEYYHRDLSSLVSLAAVLWKVNGIPKIEIEKGSGRTTLAAQFTTSEIEVEVDLSFEKLNGYSRDASIAQMTTRINATVDNVSSTDTVIKGYYKFQCPEGVWDSEKAYIETEFGIKKIRRAVLYDWYRNDMSDDTNFLGLGYPFVKMNDTTANSKTPFGDTEETGPLGILPKPLWQSLDNTWRDASAYFDVLDNKIYGFSRSYTQDDNKWKNFVYRNSFTNSTVKILETAVPSGHFTDSKSISLANYVIYLEYEPAMDINNITVSRSDLSKCNTLSTMFASYSQRQVNDMQLGEKMLMDVDMRGSERITKVIDFFNQDDIVIHPLLARDTSTGFIICNITVTLSGNKASVAYELVNEYNSMPDALAVKQTIGQIGIDYKNAIMRPVHFTEVMEIDDRYTILNDVNKPAITQKGMTAQMKFFTQDKMDPTERATDGYVSYNKSLTLATKKLGNFKTTSNNILELKTADPVFIGGEKIVAYETAGAWDSRVQYEGVPYSDGGIVKELGFGIMADPKSVLGSLMTTKAVANLPEIKTTTDINTKLEDNVLVALSNFKSTVETVAKNIGDNNFYSSSRVFTEDYKELDRFQGSSGVGTFDKSDTHTIEVAERIISLTRNGVTSFPVIDLNNIRNYIEFDWKEEYAFLFSLTDSAVLTGRLTDELFSSNYRIRIEGFRNNVWTEIGWISPYKMYGTNVIEKKLSREGRVRFLSAENFSYNINFNSDMTWAYGVDQNIVNNENIEFTNLRLRMPKRTQTLYYRTNSSAWLGNVCRVYFIRGSAEIKIEFEEFVYKYYSANRVEKFRFETNLVLDTIAERYKKYLFLDKNQGETLYLGYVQDLHTVNNDIIIGNALPRFNPMFNEYEITAENGFNFKVYVNEHKYHKNSEKTLGGFEMGGITYNNVVSTVGNTLDHAATGLKYTPTYMHTLCEDINNWSNHENKTYKGIALVLEKTSEVKTFIGFDDDNNRVYETEIIVEKYLVYAKNFINGFTKETLTKQMLTFYYNFRNELNGERLTYNPYRNGTAYEYEN